MSDYAVRAAELAESLLASPLPQRWAHTQGVAEQAQTLGPLPWMDVGVLEAGAWLHDIGYSPELVDTGFHPLDGARYLREAHDFPALVVTLVARHSCAECEARERSLERQLDTEFPVDNLPVREYITAITYCDMTTSPNGKRVTVEERLSEILERYGPESPVHRAISRAAPDIKSQCADISKQLTQQGN